MAQKLVSASEATVMLGFHRGAGQWALKRILAAGVTPARTSTGPSGRTVRMFRAKDIVALKAQWDAEKAPQEPAVTAPAPEPASAPSIQVTSVESLALKIVSGQYTDLAARVDALQSTLNDILAELTKPDRSMAQLLDNRDDRPGVN